MPAFARDWTARGHKTQQTTGRGTFVPLTFGGGEAFQFDWSEDWAPIAGERTKLQMVHFKLSHSRAFMLRAYLLQTHECGSTRKATRSRCWAVCRGAASTTT